MKRFLRQLLLSLITPLLLLALLLLAVNTGPGRRLVAWAVIEASGGLVVPSGLGGELPFAPRLDRLEIGDGQGTWLRLYGLAVTLSPGRLLRGELKVASAKAQLVTLLRLPGAGEEGPGAPQLPVRVGVEDLSIGALDLALWPQAPPLSVAASAAGGGHGGAHLDLVVTAREHTDHYRLQAALSDGQVSLDLALREGPGGLGAALAHASGVTLPPGLGAWSLDAAAKGPPRALTLGARLNAGPLGATIEGSLDLVTRSSEGLRLTADLPSMSVEPGTLPGVSWRRIRVAADLSGSLDAPRGSVQVEADGPAAGSIDLDKIRASAAGDGSRVRILGELIGLRAPLELPDTLTEGPVRLWGELEPGKSGLPFLLAVQHRVLEVVAAGSLADRAAHANLALPDLGPFGTLAGTALSGSAGVDLRIAAAGQPRLDAIGELRLTQAPGSVQGLLGPLAGVGLSAQADGDAWRIESARIDGSHLAAALQGRVDRQSLDLGWALELPNLSPLATGWSGSARAQGGISGPLVAPRLVADLDLEAVPPGQGPARIAGRFAAQPGDLEGFLRLSGDWAGQPLAAKAAARGPTNALALTGEASLTTPAGPLNLSAAGGLDAPARRLTLRRLEGKVEDARLRLLAPAVLDLANGVAVDRLRLGLGGGSIEVAGRLTPRLALDATLERLSLDLARLIAPNLPLSGSLDARLQLEGRLQAPLGSVRAEVKGLRLTEGTGRALPPARIQLAANLGAAGSDIDLQTEVSGRADLRLRGGVGGSLPLAPGDLALRAEGRLDLSLLDPLLTGGGRQLLGQTRLDARITGTPAAPRVDGALRLSDGTLWDRNIGLALTGAQGRLRLAGDTLQVERLSARAGGGDMVLTGTVGVLSPGIPLDLRLVARDARPIQLDLLNAEGDADLRLQGRATESLSATGSVLLRRVEIRLPDRLPPDIAVLEVREVGGASHPTRRAGSGPPLIPAQAVRLDLGISAPRAISVRGRGIDAELGGEIQLRGSLAKPAVSGGFDLLHGQYELVGQTLKFSRGRLGFDGAAGLDPTLDLEARVTAAGSTAILQVLGTASSPHIALRGEPELPEDEILSRLLFGVAGGRLSALQAARLGLAAASLAGIETGGGPRLLDQARTGLRLDRLSLDSDARGDPTLEGGRYISERVYLGARQGVRAGQTQGVLRMELTPRVRLEADVGSGGGTRGGGSFEIEY